MKIKNLFLLFALLFAGVMVAQENCTEERSNVSTMTAPILMAPGWARVMTCYNYERTCLTENGTSYTVDYGRECEEHITFLGVQIVDANIPAPGTCTPCRGGKQICNKNGQIKVNSCEDQIIDFQGRLILGAGNGIGIVEEVFYDCYDDYLGSNQSCLH